MLSLNKILHLTPSRSYLASLGAQESGNTSQDEDDSASAPGRSHDLPLSSSVKTPKDARPIYKQEIVEQLTKHHFANSFLEVRQSPLAGLGAFAKQDLHRGDIILKEAPLFTTNCRDLFGDFEQLDSDSRAVALDLAKNENLKTGTPALQAVMWTNS